MAAPVKLKPLPKSCPVKGFTFAHLAGGLRYSGRPDMALIVADEPCVAAGVFTRNQVAAAPVVVSKEALKKARLHKAVFLNAGRANAGTGREGEKDARIVARSFAKELGCKAEQILLCSTGVIGQRIDAHKIVEKVPAIVGGLDAKDFPSLARAIMTTDTFPKFARGTFKANGKTYAVAGIAKGSGMIAPNMATMLSVVLTDAPVSRAPMQKLLREVTDTTFNAITVDSDTSTNDTLFLLASGAAGGATIGAGSPALGALQEAVRKVCLDLAKQIAIDGEGATKFVAITVKGAKNQAQARDAAKTIADSPLVKTAMAGEDPNWGRIIAAAGRSKATINQFDYELSFDKVKLVAKGKYAGIAAEKKANAIMRKAEYGITLDLKLGKAAATFYTCDLTKDYISINADYRS